MDTGFASRFDLAAGVRGLSPEHWRGRRVTVMGLGTHGGGAGATRFLSKLGACIRLTDLRSAADLSQPLSELRDVGFESVRLGWHDAADFRDAEAVVVNPAVPHQHPLLQNLRQQRVPIFTEVGLLWQHTSARVVAVTGSVGKSTTVSMIDAILRKSGRRSWLGGNIGGSLLHNIESIAETDWLVLELSSFQLAYLNSIGFRPEIGVVTSFSPNHLDWHGTLDHYRACKQLMFAHQVSSDVAVLNADDVDIMRWPAHASKVLSGRSQRFEPLTSGSRRVVVDDVGITSVGFDKSLNAKWSKLSHIHAGPLRQNAACAAAACLAMGVSQEAIIAGLSEFAPLPHRCETLGMHAGRWWINDSKAI
jgi:UDP-N-acetylmuramoylalanine--D-glutamate ligase